MNSRPRPSAPADQLANEFGSMNMGDSGRRRPGHEPRRLPNSPSSSTYYRPGTQSSMDSQPPETPVSPMSYSDSWNHPGARIDTGSPRPPTPPRSTARSSSNNLYRTTSGTSNKSASNVSMYSLYPAPSNAPNRPLPPLPANRSPNPQRHSSSTDSHSRASVSTTRSTPPSGVPSGNFDYLQKIPTQRHSSSNRSFSQRPAVPLDLTFWKNIVSEDKRANNSVHYLDISPSSSTLASKHGNNLVKVWSVGSGNLLSTIKFSSYTEARSRSRDYLIRSHSILSESATLVAIATRFGRSIDIYDWVKKKSLQCIADADRWAATRVEIFSNSQDSRASLAVYRGDEDAVELYVANREKKKPFMSLREINLKECGLPFVPKYPELTLSATSPLMVLAAGPRPAIAGHPPPEKETLLVAWETQIDAMTPQKPYRLAQPWQHKELDTAIPCDLVCHGGIAVSIWIPASFRAAPVPASRGGTGYNLVRVEVPLRYVLLWDLATNSTKTFPIPNCTSCVSPDCRYVAYCDTTGSEIGARGTIAVLDAATGEEVWSWPDKNATSGPLRGNMTQFDDLSTITELAFSPDSRFLVAGNSKGVMGVYDVREAIGEPF